MLVIDYVVIAIVLMVIVVWLYRRQRRSVTRGQLKNRGLSQSWIDFLNQNVTLYRALPHQYRGQLHGFINIFLNDKQFIGCNGLEISDEIRLTIAAQACILLLARESEVFPDFHSVMVYPTPFYSDEKIYNGLIVSQVKSLRSGESWDKGIVVLSWDDVLTDSRGESPGQNVVIHEFAHRLDQQNASAEGVPLLGRGLYEQWAKVLGDEYKTLNSQLDEGQDTLIDSYGATSPAEFFAVVSEMFFESPLPLKIKHVELYEQLSEYYQLNPEDWCRDAS